MDDEEKAAFLKHIDPKSVWEMAEGKAKQDIDASVEVGSKVVKLDE